MHRHVLSLQLCTSMKPVIAYIDSDNAASNARRAAFLHFLEKDYGCAAVEFQNDYDFESRIDEVEDLVRRELLLCVMALEDEFEVQSPMCERILTVTRERLGGGRTGGDSSVFCRCRHKNPRERSERVHHQEVQC